MKKIKMLILAALVLLCVTPIMFNILWNLDMFNLFPTELSKGGEVHTAMTGTNPSFGDTDSVGSLHVGIGFVRLDIQQNGWNAYCNLYIAFDKNIDHQYEALMDITARAGDEFEFDGYVIRVLRVFPYSTSILGYHRGEVTLEFIDLRK